MKDFPELLGPMNIVKGDMSIFASLIIPKLFTFILFFFYHYIHAPLFIKNHYLMILKINPDRLNFICIFIIDLYINGFGVVKLVINYYVLVLFKHVVG